MVASTYSYPLYILLNTTISIYLDSICSGDALLLLLVAENNERPTIFVERERSWKGAHCILVNWNADLIVFHRLKFLFPESKRTKLTGNAADDTKCTIAIDCNIGLISMKKMQVSTKQIDSYGHL